MPTTTIPRSAAYLGQVRDRKVSSSARSAGWLLTVGTWIERYRQRRALGYLADNKAYLLDDIGLSRRDALRESAKPFWQR
jgi:uncharacterized protein YjiS (DUF1127 family)